MTGLTRCSLLRSAAATTATVWWVQGFAEPSVSLVMASLVGSARRDPLPRVTVG